jgi:hypothetical protein
MTIESSVDTQWFIKKAAENDWVAFDNRVTEVSSIQAWVDWTQVGITSKILDERDLAISLLEKTKLPFNETKEAGLRKVLQNDENIHLRRKSAIALFVHGIKDDEILDLLQDARQNDDELKE